MMVRMFHWTELDVYRFYNIGHEGYPDNLPPPPNPEGLQAFMLACVDMTIQQMNDENDPKAARQRRNRENGTTGMRSVPEGRPSGPSRRGRR